MSRLRATNEPSTSHQRLYIRSLMRQAELDTFSFTYQHRGPFKAAGLPEPSFGGNIDSRLRELSRTQAAALIQSLQQLCGRDREEDDDDDDA